MYCFEIPDQNDFLFLKWSAQLISLQVTVKYLHLKKTFHPKSPMYILNTMCLGIVTSTLTEAKPFKARGFMPLDKGYVILKQ